MYDPYKLLGLQRNASDEDVKHAFKKKAMKYHPDKHKDLHKKEVNEEKFKKAQKAYEDIMRERERKNNIQMSKLVNPTLDTYFDELFSEMEKKIHSMNFDENNTNGTFYSKTMYTCTRNGKTVTKIEENINGNKKKYESYENPNYKNITY